MKLEIHHHNSSKPFEKKLLAFLLLVFVLVLMKILPLTSQICRPHQVEATSSGGHIEWTPWNMVATIFQTCSGSLNCVRFRKVPQFERLGYTVTQFCFAGRLSTGNQQLYSCGWLMSLKLWSPSYNGWPGKPQVYLAVVAIGNLPAKYNTRFQWTPPFKCFVWIYSQLE